MKVSDPFKIVSPNERWAPTQDPIAAFQNAYEKLLPPLVYKIRIAVAKWRDEGYQGASGTSKSLLNFWFNEEHHTFFIVETKGREDLDDRGKIQRFITCGKDINTAQQEYTYTPVYVKQEKWEDVENDLKSFKDVCKLFEEND